MALDTVKPRTGTFSRVLDVALGANASIPPKCDTDEAALFKSMMGYSGKFRLEGEDQFITNLDLAWHPAWVGTEQARFFAVDRDTFDNLSSGNASDVPRSDRTRRLKVA